MAPIHFPCCGPCSLTLSLCHLRQPRVTPGQRPVLGAAVTVAHCPEAAYLAEVLVHGPARFNIGRTLLTLAAPFLSEDSPYPVRNVMVKEAEKKAPTLLFRSGAGLGKGGTRCNVSRNPSAR